MEPTSIPSLSELLCRIDRIENRNRLLMLLCCLIMFGSIGFQVARAETEAYERKIEAERFVLKDNAGRPRAALTTLDNGSAALVFMDAKVPQHIRMMTGVNGEGQPSVQLNDARDVQRAVFGLDDADAPGIDLCDRAGNRRVRLNVADRGGEQPAALNFADGKGKVRVAIISWQTMHGFSLSGPDESVRSAMSILDDGTPLSMMTAKDGKIIWSAP